MHRVNEPGGILYTDFWSRFRARTISTSKRPCWSRRPTWISPWQGEARTCRPTSCPAPNPSMNSANWCSWGSFNPPDHNLTHTSNVSLARRMRERSLYFISWGIEWCWSRWWERANGDWEESVTGALDGVSFSLLVCCCSVRLLRCGWTPISSLRWKPNRLPKRTAEIINHCRWWSIYHDRD